ncbi:hypothetical protein GGI35DRAFT_377119 [Trichoderma velutinum]
MMPMARQPYKHPSCIPPEGYANLAKDECSCRAGHGPRRCRCHDDFCSSLPSFLPSSLWPLSLNSHDANNFFPPALLIFLRMTASRLMVRTIVPPLGSDDRPCRMRLLMILLFVRLSTPCTHAPLRFVYVAYTFCTRSLCNTIRKAKAQEYMYIEYVLASSYDFVHHKHTFALLHPTLIHTYTHTYTHAPICLRLSLYLSPLSPLSYSYFICMSAGPIRINHVYYLCALSLTA